MKYKGDGLANQVDYIGVISGDNIESYSEEELEQLIREEIG